MENWGDINKADMAIIEAVSQFAMFIITIITTVLLVLTLPTIEPIITHTEEPKTLGGSPMFWMTIYSIIALWMLYAWGYKPLAALYKSELFQGRYLSALLTIFRAVFLWGALLGITFVASSTLGELFEGLAPVINIMSMALLIGAWFLIEYKRHVAIAKSFNAPAVKPRPMRNLLKPFKKNSGH